MGTLQTFLSYVNENIQEHRSRFDPTVDADDFTFAYMKEEHSRTTDEKSSDDVFRYVLCVHCVDVTTVCFSDYNMQFVALDLWIAGNEKQMWDT
jgi:hypothetical protein